MDLLVADEAYLSNLRVYFLEPWVSCDDGELFRNGFVDS